MNWGGKKPLNRLTSSKPISNKHSTAPLTGNSLVEKAVFPIRIDLYFSSLGFLIKKKKVWLYITTYIFTTPLYYSALFIQLYSYKVGSIPTLKKEETPSRKVASFCDSFLSIRLLQLHLISQMKILTNKYL